MYRIQNWQLSIIHCSLAIQPRAANFTIVAVEASAESPKQSVAGVTVHLRDRNDNSPEFSRERYEVEIPEDARPGATIAAVRAIDQDSGLLGTDGIRYTRISGPMAGFLHLDERTGSLSTVHRKCEKELTLCGL